jgi:Septum formation
MSREAAEDGGPDVAEEIEPAAMVGESAESGEAGVAGEALRPPDPDGETHEGGGPGADDFDAGHLTGDDLVESALGTAGHVVDEEDVEAVRGSLIEMAEPVELDGPGPVLHPPRRWPRLLLALGFVLLAAAIVGGAIAIVGSVTHGFKKPVKVTYTTSPVFSLKSGDCIDPQGQSYTLIPCDSPHKAEVFATFDLTGTAWPGSTALAAAASSGCATRLTGYLNPQLAVSLASVYVYPDATAWQAGTRTVICEVRAASGELTGSVRGASTTAG